VTQSKPWTGFLHLFGLCGFALAQPLFDVLGRHAAFFVAHQASPAEILLLVSVILVAPPALVSGLEALVRAVSAGAARALHLAFVGALVASIALPMAERLLGLGDVLALGCAGALGLASTLGYARVPALRSFASFLGAAPLVFATLFLATPPMSRMVGGSNSALLPPDVRAEAPVVIVVLDELGLHSLLDRHGEIDRALYPSFAALADDATWFRYASTVHTSTIHALPAIVTGRYPQPGLLPRAPDHPRNLFAWLAGSYQMHVVESQTMLHVGDPRADRHAARRLLAMLSDVGVVYLHALLPDRLARGLPDVTRTWKDFVPPQGVDFVDRAIYTGFRERRERFAAFARDIAPCERRCLHFLHVMLPHRPWEYLPSGRRYEPYDAHGMLEREQWGEDEWLVMQGQQQHLLQAAATDRFLGELIAHLEAIDLYDRALLVVTADHGASFWPGDSMRWLDDLEHPEDVLRVPLLIKAPHQDAGAVDERDAQLVDVLPTIADLLGVAIPWEVDGCSLRDPGCPGARELVVFDRDEKRHRVDAALLRRGASLERKIALFGDGSEPRSLHAFGPYAELVGRAVDAIGAAAGEPVAARLSRAPIAAAREDPAHVAWARITGFLPSRDEPEAAARPFVAIAVDDVVRAVTPALPHVAGSLRFSALVPEETVTPERHEIGVYRIEDAGSGVALRRALLEEVDLSPRRPR
jgi:hypothetical protein